MHSPLKNLHSEAQGIVFACLSAVTWGLAPLYWKLLAGFPLVQVMFYRIGFSLVLLCLFLGFIEKKKFGDLFSFLRSPRLLRTHLATSCLLGVHWALMVWGVQQGRVLEVSLGNYMIPLVNVGLGSLVFREKLSRARLVALAISLVGVIILNEENKAVSWLAIALALTFGIYGILRKTNKSSSMQTSQGDCLCLFLPALFFSMSSAQKMTPGLTDLLLLSGGGLLTALPMLWHGSALKRLPISKAGLYYYISPTLQFLTAVIIYHEHVSQLKLMGFATIWTSIAVLIISSSWKKRIQPAYDRRKFISLSKKAG